MFGLTRADRALARGQQAFFGGDVEEAVDQLSLVVEASPKWFVGHLWLGAALSEAGDLGRARRSLARAVELTGGATVAHLWLARAALDHERYGDAVEVLEMLASRGGRNLHVEGYLHLARWGATGDAEVLVERGWSAGRGGPALWARWLIEVESRFPGGPGTDFTEPPGPPTGLAARLAAGRARRLRARAARLLEKGEAEGAVAALDHADALTLGDEEAMELRLRAHLISAEMRGEALVGAPHDVDLRLGLAEDLLEIGDPTRALGVLGPAEEHIESIDPDRLSWRAMLALLRGRARLARGEAEAALDDFVKARELWPVELEPVYYHGVALLRAGRRAAARRAFTEACQMDGGLADTRLDELRAALGYPRPES